MCMELLVFFGFFKQKREEKLEEHIWLLQLLINGAIIKSDHPEEDNSKLVTENLLSFSPEKQRP